MVLLANGRAFLAAIVCAALAACASNSEPTAPTVVRTHAPQAYEKTINNYLAFRLRGPQKNTRVSVGAPEPGDCPIDGTPQSIRGWVVPVTHETFSGELTGRDTIRITAKPYWFWFSGETIAGITPRADLCPGIVSAFDEVRPRQTTTPAGSTGQPGTLQPVRLDPAAQSRATPSGTPPAKSGKKKGTSSTPARSAGATAHPQNGAPTTAKEPPAKPPQ